MQKYKFSLEDLDRIAQVRIQGAKSQGFNQYLAQLNGAAHNLDKYGSVKAQQMAQVIAGGYYLILEKGLGW